jgi:hypothetical protein
MEAIWNANPNVNKLYCFDDGNCFEKYSDALAYKKTIQADYKVVDRPTEKVEEEVKTNKKSK